MELWGRMAAGNYVLEYSSYNDSISRSTTYSRSTWCKMHHYALLPVVWARWNWSNPINFVLTNHFLQCHTLQAFNKLIEKDAFLVLKNNVICQSRCTPQNMYQAVPTFHIASGERLGEGREQGQQAHIYYHGNLHAGGGWGFSTYKVPHKHTIVRFGRIIYIGCHGITTNSALCRNVPVE